MDFEFMELEIEKERKKITDMPKDGGINTSKSIYQKSKMESPIQENIAAENFYEKIK